MHPVAVFERKATHKAAGCVAYALAVPAACVALTLCAWVPIGLIAQAAGAPEAVTVFSLPVIFLAVSAGVVRWGLREFRRRAGIRIAVFPERIEQTTERSQRTTLFSQVDTILTVPRGRDMECILRLYDGSLHRLNPQLAPYSALREAFGETLMPTLVSVASESLKSGQVIDVQEPTGAALRRILLGWLRQFGGVLLMLTIRGLGAGIEQIAAGRMMVLRGQMGRNGGFSISDDGLTYHVDGFGSVAAWNDLRVIRNDHAGIVLETCRGDRLSATPYADKFVIAALLIEERLSSESDVPLSVAGLTASPSEMAADSKS